MKAIWLVSVAVLVLSGCSASHWGGRAAGESPGVYAKKGLCGVEVGMTSDGSGKIDELAYKTKNGEELSLKGLKVSQVASAVVAEEPAKINAIANLQQVQVDYVRETWTGVNGLARELLPVLRLLAAAQIDTTSTGFNLSLPSGVTLGGSQVHDAGQLRAFFQESLSSVERVATESPPPTSQPVTAGH